MITKEAIEKRYSTRNYKKGIKIDKKDIDVIVNAGYLAPNGLACEPWKFLVIEENIDKLATGVYNQRHVLDASFIVVLLHLKAEYVNENSEILFSNWQKLGLTIEQQQQYFKKLQISGNQYYREQLMFAAANMTIQAAALEVGSVVVGGFDKTEIAKQLKIDTYKYEVGLIVDFGISADEKPKQRQRRNKVDVIEYIKISRKYFHLVDM